MVVAIVVAVVVARAERIQLPNPRPTRRHISTASDGTMSTRANTTIRGRALPTHSLTSGWAVDEGIRASRNSITTSTRFKQSISCFSALGNVWELRSHARECESRSE